MSPKQRLWVAALAVLIALGLACYLRQLDHGLGLTGMSRDVSWGLYIGQFTFAVGIAASAVMLVLPYYLHNTKAFSQIVLYGEFLSVAAVLCCLLFILVDMGQPARVLNMLLYPSPRSVMFWDMLSLTGYLALNTVIAAATLRSERRELPPPAWLRPIVLLSVPWAISIHTVTAFLYCGLAARPAWFTAILAPRFLASAFASGPALLILVLRAARVRVESAALRKLTVIVTYAMALHIFFILLELFTHFYSGIPHHALPLLTWIAAILAAISLLLLTSSRLTLACSLTFLSLWLDKGLNLVISGFIPSPLNAVTPYVPTLPEISIAAAVWSCGALIATLLFRTAVSVRAESNHRVEAPHFLGVPQ
jgi:molybdopterin-containing oxidoreductase family membrane subunit